jgi:DNA-directed RNA polymerase subunit H (RpoH/RPB5)/NADH:ubiquinone oxidoreductase subunit C
MTTAAAASAAILSGNASGTITAIYKSRTNMLSLLKTQGYDVSQYDNFGMNEVHAMNTNKQLDMLVVTETGQKAYVKYHLGKPLRRDNITEYVQDLYHLEKTLTKQDSLIIVMKAEMNDTNVATLSQIWEQDSVHIVIFSLDRLQFNILEHTYVPKHTILTDAETQQMMAKYNIAHPDMLPNISRYDPVAMAMGMRPGQVCRIDRFSKTAVSTPYYRICTQK